MLCEPGEGAVQDRQSQDIETTGFLPTLLGNEATAGHRGGSSHWVLGLPALATAGAREGGRVCRALCSELRAGALLGRNGDLGLQAAPSQPGRAARGSVGPALAKCRLVWGLPTRPTSLPAGWLGPDLSGEHILCQ